MSADEIAQAFVKHYFETRGTNPPALAGLYVIFILRAAEYSLITDQYL